MLLSGRNFRVLRHTVCAQISLQKTLLPGPRFIQLLHQSTRQPQLIKNKIATASLSLHTHCHAKTKQLESTCWPSRIAVTKVHLASTRHAKVAGSAGTSLTSGLRTAADIAQKTQSTDSIPLYCVKTICYVQMLRRKIEPCSFLTPLLHVDYY